MPRYIDADKLIAGGWRLERQASSGKILSVMSIADVPTADVVEVVRCGNCKHSNEDGTICRYSVGRAVEPTHYCSYGERKNENSN